MTITDKQRKILWAAALVLAAVHYVPQIVMSARQAAHARQAAEYRQKMNLLAQAQRKAGQSPLPGSSTPKPGDLAGNDSGASPDNRPSLLSENLSGIWEGRYGSESLGFCDLRVELKQIGPTQYTGYSRFSCLEAGMVLWGRKNPKTSLPGRLNPDAAILRGVVENGHIQFRADQDIGTDIHGCALTSLKISPFGTNVIAAQWEKGTCAPGNALLQRQRS